MSELSVVRVGVLGFGTVGKGTVRLLLEHGEMLRQRCGVTLQLVRIATLDPHVDRGIALGDVEVTADASRVVAASDIDVVVELIGGTTLADQYIRTALAHGKHVVTANKALLAVKGNALLAEAEDRGLQVGFEAAVAGAIPVIRTLRESLAANRIERFYGILNGTCNYILTEMRQKGLSFDEVLGAAQQAGYAEADPSFDVDGIDAAHKLTILASLAFGIPLNLDQLYVEGIRRINAADIAWATEMGYRIKLLAIGKRHGDTLELRVHPTLVAEKSMLAAVEGVYNGVFIHGDYAGTTLYYGRGAGERPTASAVVSDLVEIARNLKAGSGPRMTGLSWSRDALRELAVREMAELEGGYYLRFAVVDRPGVLAEITRILWKHQISIDAIHQKGHSPVDTVPLVMVTHRTTEKNVMASLAEIQSLDVVRESPCLIRIEELPTE